MPQKFSNNGSALLAQDLIIGQTLIVVQAGYGGRFPTTDTDDEYFLAVLDDGVGNREIVRCTLRSGDSLVVVRAWEATTERDFPAGARIGVRMTAGTMGRFIEPDTAQFLGDVDLNANALTNGEIVAVPVRGESADVSNQLVVPPAGARPTIGGVDILLETDNPLTAGMIFMWSGSPLAVPMGWNLCDGTNSTPDLSGRFIVSYDVAEPLFDTIGNLGGNFSAQPAGAHTHGGASGTTLKASDIPTLPLTTHLSTSNNSGDDHQFVNQPSAGANSNDFAATEAVEYVNATPTPHPHDMQNSGTHFHEAVPVYYTLAYIQFAGVAIPPIFTGTLADQAYAEGEAIAPIDTTLLFNEGNGLTPTYSAVNLPAGLSIVATGVGRGVISGTVDVGAASLSPYAVQVTLTTSLGAADSNIANWTVVVNPNLPVPGFSIWLNPDTLTTLGGNVTGWANDLTATRGTQADTNAQGAAIPESTDPTTGLAIVEAPDVTLRSLVAATPFVISSGFTLFVVGRLDPASSGGTLVDMDTTPGDRAIVNTSGATLTISGDDVGVITTLANDNLPHVFACRYDSTSYRARISGQPVWTISGVGIAQNWNYGKFLQSFTPNNQQAIGWIGELVVYEEGLSDVQMDALFDYYLNKWSL